MKRIQTFYNLILLSSFIVVLFSCSSGDDALDDGKVYGKDVYLEISDITYNGVTASYTSEFTRNSHLNIFYSVTNKNTNKTKRYPIQKNLVISDLNPANMYEMKITYDNPEGEEVNFRSQGEEFFTPLLFQLKRETNSHMDFGEQYIYSHEGFSHILYKKDQNTDSSEIYLINSENPKDSIVPLDLKILKDKIEFKLPDDIIPNDPHEYFRDYLIGVKSGKSYHYLINTFDEEKKVVDNPIKIRLYNKQPQIEGISNYYENVFTDCSHSIYLSFSGQFFTTHKSSASSYLFYTPGLTEKSTAIITRLSDGKEYIVDDELTDHYGDGECLAYDRQTIDQFEQPLRDFPSLHYAALAQLKIPMGGSEPFAKGEYKVKFTFNWEGEHYETNEFPFTLN